MRPDLRWTQNTCPICGRTFKITPQDDILVPACGCYDTAPDGELPCEPCGISHVYSHTGEEPPERRLVGVVDGDQVVADAEGDAGDALLGEFFVEP